MKDEISWHIGTDEINGRLDVSPRMNIPLRMGLLAVVLNSSACAKQEWLPYLESPSGVTPDVTFSTLVECQQYLHLRFGNIKGPAVMWCISGCTKSAAAPGPTDFRVGDRNCPLSGKQVVGQLVQE
jgi:hypothetical protein